MARRKNVELDWMVHRVEAELRAAARHLTPRERLDFLDGMLNSVVQMRNAHAELFPPSKPRKKPQPKGLL